MCGIDQGRKWRQEGLEGAEKIKSRAGGYFRFYCNTGFQWILNVRYTRREFLRRVDACECVSACVHVCVHVCVCVCV